jgi:hypothetical protein
VPLARLGRLVTRGRVASTPSRYQGATPPDETIRARFDRNDSFVFGFSKIDVMFGRTTLPQARAYYREIPKPSVSFHQKAITSIDPTTRKVSTDQGRYQADVLAAELGADRSTSPGGTGGWSPRRRMQLTSAPDGSTEPTTDARGRRNVVPCTRRRTHAGASSTDATADTTKAQELHNQVA